MGYVMGVDAGGTKSHLVLMDLQGNPTGSAVWGTLNHEMMPDSFPQFARELSSFVHAGLAPLNLTTADIDCAVFGVAGADTEEQHAIIGGIIKDLGFPNWHLYNDAFLGIPAGSPDGTGICAINGTGATLAGIDAKGRRMQIGGIGAFSDDRAGAGQLGRYVLSAVYTSLFRSGRQTALAGRLFDILGIQDKADYVEALTQKIAKEQLDIAQLNRLLFECGEKGDEVSLAILYDSAENYSGAIRCMVKELEFPEDEEVHVTLAGSVFVKERSPLLRDMLMHITQEAMPEQCFSFTVLDIPPVGGAVLWGFEKLHLHSLRETVHQGLVRMQI